MVEFKDSVVPDVEQEERPAELPDVENLAENEEIVDKLREYAVRKLNFYHE